MGIFRDILLIVITTCFLNNSSYAQTKFMKIDGKVMDSSNYSPLGHASVYLSNTSIGTTTSQDGSFFLTNIPPGSYKLIISYIGFKTQIFTIDEQSNERFFTIQMKRDVTQLERLVVNADKFNKAYLKDFEKYFIGTDENASNCIITNPEVLFFYFNKQTSRLTANATKVLVIANKSLGYKIYYDLQYFYFDDSTRHLTYFGYPKFEALHAKNERTKRQWDENRMKAYLGSMRHFMKALISRKLKKEGFKVHKLEKIEDPYSKKTYTLVHSDGLPYDSIIAKARDRLGYVKLIFDNSLYITYSPPRWTGISPKIHIVISPIQTLIKSRYPPSILTLIKATYIDRNGDLTDPMMVIKKGGWAHNSVADLLPINYEPSRSGTRE